jgi:hypothetical protein
MVLSNCRIQAVSGGGGCSLLSPLIGNTNSAQHHPLPAGEIKRDKERETASEGGWQRDGEMRASYWKLPAGIWRFIVTQACYSSGSVRQWNKERHTTISAQRCSPWNSHVFVRRVASCSVLPPMNHLANLSTARLLECALIHRPIQACVSKLSHSPTFFCPNWSLLRQTQARLRFIK